MTRYHILALCFALGCPAVQGEPEVRPQAAEQQTVSPHPFFEDTLYPSWSRMSPEQARQDIRAAVLLAKERQARIRSVKPEEATWDNVFAAYDDMAQELDRAETFMHHLASVMDTPELRAVQEELVPELSEFSAGITADEQLWHVIKAAAAAPWVQQLSPAKQRLVQQIVDSFRDSGADLAPEQKKKLADMNRELSTLTLQFSKNVLDSTNRCEWLVTDPARLAGMSEDWMERAAHKAQEKHGKKNAWLINLDESSAREVLYSCSVESTRHMCWEGINSVGSGEPFDNEAIVARIMELRTEKARLLGFATYADLKLAHRMAGSGEHAMAFVDEMMQKVKPAYDAEVKQLMDYIALDRGVQSDKLNPWDTPYYLRKLSKERFAFDPETLRPYQECSRVLRGMFAIFQHLYSIRIEELPAVCLQAGETCPAGSVEVWHPEVRVFAVHDAKTGAHLGSFYMDLFPRASKRSGAWVLPLSYGDPAANGRPHKPHLATLSGNLSPATADKPALFSHYDVETIFHEFGHMMHSMLSDTELRSHSGTSVAWDFVELPSQMNEDWCWEPLGMATYAVHYKTGEPLPMAEMEKLRRSRFFFPAHDNMGQLRLAKLDMEMHMHYAEKFREKGLDAASEDLLAPWKAPSDVRPPSIMRHLTHCVSGGYAAGYYSYKWAEVLAADVFTRFAREGVLNKNVGAEYRRCILSQGDSRPAGELYRDFMGRDPNPDALLEKQKLIQPAQ